MFEGWRKGLGMVAALTVLLSATVGGAVQDKAQRAPASQEKEFRTLAREVMEIERACIKLVEKRVELACASGDSNRFSDAAMKTAKELTEFTNALLSEMQATKTDTVTGSSVDPARYPLVNRFFEQARQFRLTSDDMVAGQLGAQRDPSAQWVAEYYCGWYSWPRPSSAAPWLTYWRSDPAATLRSWGYHETPDSAGGGWTKPETYMWWLCGWSTYRDHAYITGNIIHEQEYLGEIPGEPNPEVWRSGPWPYATWPAYVYWWHRTY